MSNHEPTAAFALALIAVTAIACLAVVFSVANLESRIAALEALK
jgi:uncharacterized small protein (DUF1192 family)